MRAAPRSITRVSSPKFLGPAESPLRVAVATLCRLLVALERRLEVDRQGELANLVGEAESEMRGVVATLRRLPVPLQRRLEVDRQGELAELAGLAESRMMLPIMMPLFIDLCMCLHVASVAIVLLLHLLQH